MLMLALYHDIETDPAYLLGSDRLLRCLCKLLDRLRIVSQIALAANKYDWETLAEVKHFGNPLWGFVRDHVL